MPHPKKNPGACALNPDVVYVFGGKTVTSNGQLMLSDSIYQYIVASNIWLELPIRLPSGMGLVTTMKVNDHSIALFGGLTTLMTEK